MGIVQPPILQTTSRIAAAIRELSNFENVHKNTKRLDWSDNTSAGPPIQWNQQQHEEHHHKYVHHVLLHPKQQEIQLQQQQLRRRGRQEEEEEAKQEEAKKEQQITIATTTTTTTSEKEMCPSGLLSTVLDCSHFASLSIVVLLWPFHPDSPQGSYANVLGPRSGAKCCKANNRSLPFNWRHVQNVPSKCWSYLP